MAEINLNVNSEGDESSNLRDLNAKNLENQKNYLEELKKQLVEDSKGIQDLEDKVNTVLDKNDELQQQNDNLTSMIEGYENTFDQLDSRDTVIPNFDRPINIPSSPGANGDVVLQQRIENLSRTIDSKEFRNVNTQLDPYFNNLKDKASKQQSPEELARLLETEMNKQVANVVDVETSLYNSIDLMTAQIEAKLDRIAQASAKSEQPPEENPLFIQYTQFQEQLSNLRQHVSGYIEESVDKIKSSSEDYARTGYNEGVEQRFIDQGLKEQKRVEKIVADFNKDFDKYIEEQKESIAKQYAFDMAQSYLNSDPNATSENAKRIYKNAFNDFNDNVPVTPHGLSDEEISAMYTASGGNVDASQYAPQIQTPEGFDQDKDYTGAPDSNMSSLQKPSSVGASKIPVHMIMSEVTSAILDPMMSLAIELRKVVPPDLKNYATASSKQRINPGDYVNSGTDKAQAGASAIGKGAGSLIGGMIGGLPGAFVGSKIGETAAELLPFKEFGMMVNYLYQIAENTSQQAMPFSPELIQANVDRQLAFLEENIAIGEDAGAELASLNNSITNFQLEFYREALEILRPMLPLMNFIVNQLSLISKAISAGISGILGWMSGGWMNGVKEFILNLGNVNRPRQSPGRKDFMDQLDDNVPFL
jgi:hypothetical protein